MKPLIKRHLRDLEIYTLYIHPFELSKREMPGVDDASFLTNIRARTGLKGTSEKIEKLILLLKNNGFDFCTFTELTGIIEGRQK